MIELPAALTQSEAEALALARLKSRCPTIELSIVAGGTAERAFGWVFEIAVSGGDARVAPIPRRVIVNRHSRQVIASTAEHDAAQFVRLYEKLLADNQARSAQWCGTLSEPWPWKLWGKKNVAARAKDGGFYELGAKEGES